MDLNVQVRDKGQVDVVCRLDVPQRNKSGGKVIVDGLIRKDGVREYVFKKYMNNYMLYRGRRESDGGQWNYEISIGRKRG